MAKAFIPPPVVAATAASTVARGEKIDPSGNDRESATDLQDQVGPMRIQSNYRLEFIRFRHRGALWT